jgi:hypothetical protein
MVLALKMTNFWYQRLTLFPPLGVDIDIILSIHLLLQIARGKYLFVISYYFIKLSKEPLYEEQHVTLYTCHSILVLMPFK